MISLKGKEPKGTNDDAVERTPRYTRAGMHQRTSSGDDDNRVRILTIDPPETKQERGNPNAQPIRLDPGVDELAFFTLPTVRQQHIKYLLPQLQPKIHSHFTQRNPRMTHTHKLRRIEWDVEEEPASTRRLVRILWFSNDHEWQALFDSACSSSNFTMGRFFFNYIN